MYMSSRRSQEKRWTFITVELARQKAPGFVGWFETPPSGFRPVPNPPAVGASTTLCSSASLGERVAGAPPCGSKTTSGSESGGSIYLRARVRPKRSGSWNPRTECFSCLNQEVPVFPGWAGSPARCLLPLSRNMPCQAAEGRLRN